MEDDEVEDEVELADVAIVAADPTETVKLLASTEAVERAPEAYELPVERAPAASDVRAKIRNISLSVIFVRFVRQEPAYSLLSRLLPPDVTVLPTVSQAGLVSAAQPASTR